MRAANRLVNPSQGKKKGKKRKLGLSAPPFPVSLDSLSTFASLALSEAAQFSHVITDTSESLSLKRKTIFSVVQYRDFNEGPPQRHY